ncbi:uncharacterized protein LOC135013963, partial [Pseudophryne corroboree]|uniref:uncharacterized protein LOC135013963 n=1 Tax=Pseudophryne corroboree TaxID=495146 RepID=UPI00308199E2
MDPEEEKKELCSASFQHDELCSPALLQKTSQNTNCKNPPAPTPPATIKAQDLASYFKEKIDKIRDEMVTECLSAISSWMTSRHLKLNISKTELIIFPPANSRYHPDISITVKNSTIYPTPQARCLGVILDSDLSFVPHIQSVSRSCYMHLKNISKIRPYLTQDTAKTLIHALIISCIDYCNSLLTGLPKTRLSPLQSILNAAARLIFLARRSSSADPLCQSLHWLPVLYRIQYKILLLTHKAINQTT